MRSPHACDTVPTVALRSSVCDHDELRLHVAPSFVADAESDADEVSSRVRFEALTLRGAVTLPDTSVHERELALYDPLSVDEFLDGLIDAESDGDAVGAADLVRVPLLDDTVPLRDSLGHSGDADEDGDAESSSVSSREAECPVAVSDERVCPADELASWLSDDERDTHRCLPLATEGVRDGLPDDVRLGNNLDFDVSFFEIVIVRDSTAFVTLLELAAAECDAVPLPVALTSAVGLACRVRDFRSRDALSRCDLLREYDSEYDGDRLARATRGPLAERDDCSDESDATERDSSRVTVGDGA